MSYTSTYKLFRTKVSIISEHNNGYGSAPLVWNYLEQKYLPPLQYSRMSMSDGVMKDVWNLVKDSRLKIHERFALYATFDWYYCETEYLGTASDYLDQFFNETVEAMPGKVNHWSDIANDYRSAGKDKRMLGVCMNPTSVCDMWDNYPKYGSPHPIFAAMNC